ncbi:hypothetical protein [Streptomyces sp. NPDC048639]|uniref:hypothetical protein n=1 Tax=Streptomyces sp. NPDC048639 TaxID=3365581 RepID=UPI0037129BE8
MSDIADTPKGVFPTARSTSAEPHTREAYSFACMRCGHGWEQAYEIHHHVDAQGRAHVTYHANGHRVPSPLTRPTCQNCDGHVVRIMRSGQIPLAAAGLAEQGIAGPLLGSAAPAAPAPMEPPVTTRTGETAGGEGTGQEGAEREGTVASGGGGEAQAAHRRHLSDLFHRFHRKAS